MNNKSRSEARSADIECGAGIGHAGRRIRRFNARVRYAQGRVHWEIEQRAGAPAHIHVRVPRLRFANVDAAGAVRAIYQRRAGTGRGTLDLSAAFDRFLIARAPRYLPSRLNAALRAY